MEEGNQEKEPKGDSKSLDHLPESVRNAILRAKKLKGNSLENTLQDTKEASQENKVIHRRFYSPLVRSTAKENGISQTELDGILGSGKDGRVTKRDVLSYLEGGRIAAASLEVEATYDEFATMIESGNTVEQFINETETPRKIITMLPNGLNFDFLDYMSPNDTIIDCSNERWNISNEKSKICNEKNIKYLGVGMSGGHLGALHGPAVMIGGPREVYDDTKEFFESFCNSSVVRFPLNHIALPRDLTF